MNSKAVAAIAIVAVVIVAAVAVWQLAGDDGGSDEPKGDSITVTDSSGRTIEVSLPVERVAICDPTIVEIFAMSVGEGWEDYVCLLPEDIKTREPAKWDLLLESYPELADVPMCGDVFSTGAIPAQLIYETEADLVLLAGATVNYMPGMEEQIEALGDGISVVYLEFYDKSFTDGIAESNYGILGDIMGTSETADKVVDFYNEKLDYVMDAIAGESREFSYYVELPGSDQSVYGNVVAMGCPEFNVLGGNNICDSAAGVDTDWNLEKMLEPDGDGPDYIVLVCTPYYGGLSTLGYGASPTDGELADAVSGYLDRPGWSDLGAVKDGNVLLCYGELRNSVFGLVDLYSVAMMICPDLVTQEDLDGVIAGLDELSPFGFEGTWSYLVGA